MYRIALYSIALHCNTLGRNALTWFPSPAWLPTPAGTPAVAPLPPVALSLAPAAAAVGLAPPPTAGTPPARGMPRPQPPLPGQATLGLAAPGAKGARATPALGC